VTYDLLALGEAVEIDGEEMFAIRSGGRRLSGHADGQSWRRV
jgi:hypothetical protein